jgi:hypothetical protein
MATSHGGNAISETRHANLKVTAARFRKKRVILFICGVDARSGRYSRRYR